jgi:hypothetical protein
MNVEGPVDVLVGVFMVLDLREWHCAQDSPIYEFMKFGFLFSTKAVMPDIASVRRGDRTLRPKDSPRTLPLILRCKRHVEQPTFGPQPLRQTLLIRYNPPTNTHTRTDTTNT